MPSFDNEPLLGDDTTTIHSNPQSMSSAEREAVKKGEARGKREMVAAHPEYFEMVRQRGIGLKKFDAGYEKIDWSEHLKEE